MFVERNCPLWRHICVLVVNAATGNTRSMNIILSTGTGVGPTARAAYDAALFCAGVTDYNMIYLSSVIPPHCCIFREAYRTPADDYGKRLYVVQSKMTQSQSGMWAHAALGWLQEERTGRGLFIDLHDDNLERLQRDLHATAQAMQGNRAIGYGPLQAEFVSMPCREQPVCALVIAVYTAKPLSALNRVGCQVTEGASS